MTRKELAVKACIFAVVSILGKGIKEYVTRETGETEKIDWYDVLAWLEEVGK